MPPNPPPTGIEVTRTLAVATLSTLATSSRTKRWPWVGLQIAITPPGSGAATTTCGSMKPWCAPGMTYRPSTTTSASASPAATSPRFWRATELTLLGLTSGSVSVSPPPWMETSSKPSDRSSSTLAADSFIASKGSLTEGSSSYSTTTRDAPSAAAASEVAATAAIGWPT